jgi:E3 ubiquitin-protein ligase ZNRF1/2
LNVVICDLIKKVKRERSLLLLLLLQLAEKDKEKKNALKMGAKASTNGNQSPRTFSNSSSSDVVSAGNNAQNFNFLRAMHGVEVANDSRQRARSMSSVPDIQSASTNHHHHHPNAYSNHHSTHNSQPYSHDVNGFQHTSGAGPGQHFDLSSVNPEDGSNHDDNNSMLQGINALGLGRVYTAASLPSHIWSINGEQKIYFYFSMCVRVYVRMCS